MRHFSMQIARAALAATALLAAAGCYRNKEFEDANPNVPGTKFKTIATLSANDAGTAIRLMVQVREKLKTAGYDAESRSGRWDNAADAVNQICAPGVDVPVDGVLIVSFDRLTLYDCQTVKPAYDIQSSPMAGGMGLDQMTKRLINYLQGKGKPHG